MSPKKNTKTRLTMSGDATSLASAPSGLWERPACNKMSHPEQQQGNKKTSIILEITFSDFSELDPDPLPFDEEAVELGST